MGGSTGCCDAIVGAVESQKADGVLHVHFFVYLQMLMQFSTLHDLARVLREGMLSADAIKQFVSHVRCASYPDLEAFREGRTEVEKAWPAYADDVTLSRLPQFSGRRQLLRERNGCGSIDPDCSTVLHA